MNDLFDNESEQEVLGSMLAFPHIIANIQNLLPNQAFFLTKHRLVYSAIIDVFEIHNAVDFKLVSHHLDKTDDLKRCGDAQYVAELQTTAVDWENAEAHANILLDLYRRREMIRIGKKIEASAADMSTDINDVEDTAHTLLSSTYTPAMSSDMKVAMKSTIEEFNRRANNKSNYVGVPCGYSILDDMLLGFQKSCVYLLGAGTSVGKSAFALNIAAGVCERTEGAVLMYSLEMPKETLVSRLLANKSGLGYNVIATGGNLTQEQRTRLSTAVNKVMSYNLHFVDDMRISTDALLSIARSVQYEEKQLELVIVDYAQLVRVNEKKHNREQEVSEVSSALKRIAYELQVPVLALSQLNRNVEQRSDRQPRLSDLRESGSLEHDPDVVMFLDNDTDVDYNDPERYVNLYIRKNRTGKLGGIAYRFETRLQKFVELEETLG